MGWTPSDVDECSLWTLRRACDGWVRANGGEKAEAPSEEDHLRLMAKHGGRVD